MVVYRWRRRSMGERRQRDSYRAQGRQIRGLGRARRERCRIMPVIDFFKQIGQAEILDRHSSISAWPA